MRIPSFLLCIVTLTCARVGGQETAPTAEVLTLDQALAEARENNRQIKIAQQSVFAANDQILAARTQRLPHFNAMMTGGSLLNTVGVEFNKGVFCNTCVIPIPPENTTVSTSPHFSGFGFAEIYQPLSELYNIHLNIEASEVGKRLAEEQVRQQRQQIVNSVKDAYYSLLQTQSALDAADQNVKSLREVDRTTDEYLKQKTVLPYQSTAVKAQLAQAELQVITLQDTFQTQKENLNVLLGRDVRRDYRLSALPEEMPEEKDLESAREKALGNRTEIRQAKIKIDQAMYARRIEKAEYIPQIGIDYMFVSPFSAQGLPGYINSIGIRLKWDFYDWGYKKHLMDQDERKIEQSKLNLTETQSQVAVDLGNRFRKLREARANVKVAQLAQQAEKEKLEIVLEQYKQKAALLTNVLSEQANMAQADSQYQQAVAGFWTARSDFAKALGED